MGWKNVTIKANVQIIECWIKVIGLVCVLSVLYYYYYYCVFILSAISPYTTGLKALFNQSDCTGTAPTDK